MAEAENIAVEVQVDISDISSSLKEMTGKLGMLQNAVRVSAKASSFRAGRQTGVGI